MADLVDTCSGQTAPIGRSPVGFAVGLRGRGDEMTTRTERDRPCRARDDSGAALVEFAFVAVPLLRNLEVDCEAVRLAG